MRLFGAAVLCPVVCCASAAQVPVAFEPNSGQSSHDVRYLARGAGAMVLVRDRGIVLHRRTAAGADSSLHIDFAGARRGTGWQPLGTVGTTMQLAAPIAKGSGSAPLTLRVPEGFSARSSGTTATVRICRRPFWGARPSG